MVSYYRDEFAVFNFVCLLSMHQILSRFISVFSNRNCDEFVVYFIHYLIHVTRKFTTNKFDQNLEIFTCLVSQHTKEYLCICSNIYFAFNIAGENNVTYL